MGWWSKYRDWLKHRREPDPQIQFEPDGFVLVSSVDRQVVASVRWSEVTSIRTYKLDLLTTDCICLLFELHNEKPPVQVSEEWSGFADMFEALARAFPGIPRDWYMEVMSPAFETKGRVLYDSAVTRQQAVV